MSGVISAVTYWMGKGTGGIVPAAMSRLMESPSCTTGARGIQAAANKAELSTKDNTFTCNSRKSVNDRVNGRACK